MFNSVVFTTYPSIVEVRHNDTVDCFAVRFTGVLPTLQKRHQSSVRVRQSSQNDVVMHVTVVIHGEPRMPSGASDCFLR